MLQALAVWSISWEQMLPAAEVFTTMTFIRLPRYREKRGDIQSPAGVPSTVLSLELLAQMVVKVA
jgi:hypothetical protein